MAAEGILTNHQPAMLLLPSVSCFSKSGSLFIVNVKEPEQWPFIPFIPVGLVIDLLLTAASDFWNIL